MSATIRHRWDLTIPQATALQNQLRTDVVDDDRFSKIRTVAGADVASQRRGPMLYAAIIVLDAQTLEVVDGASARQEATFPYVPGYLSFREIPPLLKAFENLRVRPDLIVCDGQGRAHPRRFGLACHLGLRLDLPAIGCAKSRLIGTHRTPGDRRGCRAALRDKREIIGEVLRTRDRVKPVYVSVGHRISLPTARRWILRLAPNYRLPEPIRAAHHAVNRLRREDQ